MPVVQREMAADGTLVPAWLQGDEDGPERLQVSVLWRPEVYVNGVQASAWELAPGLDPMPELYSGMTLHKRALIANREAAVQDEIRGWLIHFREVTDPFIDLNCGYLPVVLRASLARRGFPVL